MKYDVKEISEVTEIKDLYFDLLKSSSKEIMLIFPTSKAFDRQERIGIISLLKQGAREKNMRVRVLVHVKNLENSQELVQKQFPLKENYQQDSVYNMTIKFIAEHRSADLQETILIVDRTVSFVIEVIDDTKSTFEEAIGLATYSNSKSTVLSYVSIFESLWKQSELYQKLNELYQRLQEHYKMQEGFIDVAAHELRVPVQPILTLSEFLLSEEVKIDDYKGLLNAIIRNAKRLKMLTENILDATRIDSQSLKLNKQNTKLNDIITKVIAEKEENYKQNKIKFAYSSNNDNIIVNADADRLAQVVSNLLSNANKFTLEGEISVNISSNHTEQQIIVSVSDTGRGIDPVIMPRLFTKFPAFSIGAGTGLGLFISKGIIEAHGGKMWAENNSNGIGATFSFTLPMGNRYRIVGIRFTYL